MNTCFWLLLGIVHTAGAETDKEKQYLAAYYQILAEMESKMQSAPQTGEATLDFLEEMIPHHEDAVGMAKNILAFTANEELRSIATGIITKQQQQLQEMHRLLDR
ncbi:MAG: DUF305 domain-containing protein [Bacillus sp. (in: firmicutes)]